MLWAAEIITAWGIDAKDKNVPQVTLDHPFVQVGEKWSEGEGGYGSGQGVNLLVPPLSPDLCIIYAQFTAEHMDAILADGDHGEGAFLWLEEMPEEVL